MQPTVTLSAADLREMVTDAVAYLKAAGIADGRFAAEHAARQAAPQDCCVVEPGGSAEFLRVLPDSALDDAELGTLAEVVPRVVRYLPGSGRWAGQVFVDTPDLNSIAQEHAGAALAVLDQVDAAILVFHRGSVAEARPSDALRPFARRRALEI